jgi:hypothetical protein
MTLPPPSNKTAFWAGVWTGVVTLIYFVFQPSFDSVEASNNAFLAVGVIGLLPTFPFVFGVKKSREGPIENKMREGLADFGAMIKRGLVWMFGAAVVHLPLTLYKVIDGFPI